MGGEPAGISWTNAGVQGHVVAGDGLNGHKVGLHLHHMLDSGNPLLHFGCQRFVEAARLVDMAEAPPRPDLDERGRSPREALRLDV